MMQWLYNLSITVFALVVRCVAPFHRKARLAIQGRQHLDQFMLDWRKKNSGPLVWFHCASLGEFEQGRTLIDAIRKSHPEKKILLTFFSPSGYEIRKNYSGVDMVTYLPFDMPNAMKRFVKIVNPKVVIVIKYEYWVNWFQVLHHNSIPVFIIAAKLRSDQRFFGLFGRWWQRTLKCVTHFYAQDQKTVDLLAKTSFHNTTLAGDTRFDRVHEIHSNGVEIPEIRDWCAQSKVLVFGSSWSVEEQIAIQISVEHPEWKIILVPHNVDQEKLTALSLKHSNSILFSELNSSHKSQNLLLVNTTGLLSSIYRYGQLAVIGGGFGQGIHNILEAAAWNIPVLFGPKYHKFIEAIQLIQKEAALGLDSPTQLKKAIEEWMLDEKPRISRGIEAGQYVNHNVGATQKILQHAEIQRELKK